MKQYNSLSEFVYDKKQEEKSETQEVSYEYILDKTKEYFLENYSEQLSAVITDQDASEVVRRLVGDYIKACEHRIEGVSISELTEMLLRDMVGFGFLEKYIQDESVEEINGNSWRDIEIVSMGRYKKLKERFPDPQRTVDIIKKMARLGGLILDNQTPIIDSFITKGIRLSAAIPPAVDEDTAVAFSLRRQRMTKTTAIDLLNWQTASKDELNFITLMADHGISVGFAGATGSGKTTDISYLLNSVDIGKRIYTIEENRELDLTKEDQDQIISRVVHMCTRESTSDKMTIDTNKLLRHALRFNPDVICVAEMRGEEAMTAQEAARTGHAVVTSLHANNARAAYYRILSLCRMGGTELSDTTLMRFIIEAFPVMVYKKQMPDGTRRIMEIIEATGLKPDATKKLAEIMQALKLKRNSLRESIQHQSISDPPSEPSELRIMMEYLNKTNIEDDVIQATTLFRFDVETKEHLKVGVISDTLAQRLLDDGVDKKELSRFCSEDFIDLSEGRDAI